MTTAKTIQAYRQATGYTGPMTHRHHQECEQWERERIMTQDRRAKGMQAIESLIAGLPPLKSDMDLIAEQCAAIDRMQEEIREQAVHEHDCAVAINTRHECSCGAGDREAGWVSVSELYPDDARDVLTRGRYGLHTACFEWGAEDDPCWWTDEVSKADFKESVTHWRDWNVQLTVADQIAAKRAGQNLSQRDKTCLNHREATP